MRRKLWGKTYIWEQWITPLLPMILMLLIVCPMLFVAINMSSRNVVGRAQGDKSPKLEGKESQTPKPSGIEPVKRREFVSPLAGNWYEADKDRLSAQLDSYLEKATIEKRENIHALILPHAGYRWSGPTAAYGVKHLVGRKYSRMIVIGPSHRVLMNNIASVPDFTHLVTPLGEVALDLEFIRDLKKHNIIKTIPSAHDGEHSVQIEVPLLQKVLGDFKLVPIVVGQLDLAATHRLAKVLLGLIDENTLVVASSDFTHYGASFRYTPFKEDISENLKKLAMDAFGFIEKKDLEGFFGHLEKTRDTICGRCPVGILLAMLPADSKANLEYYDTSGNLTGNYSSSVSYLSITFSGKWEKGKTMDADTTKQTLSENDKQLLLKLARGTLAYVLENNNMPTPEDLGIEITQVMNETMGAFVTLKKHGQLRGCIGEIIPRRPLYEAVMGQAINAGLRDHRFPQVSSDELDDLHFEISAYASAPEPVDSYEDIVLGRHGMVLEKNGRQALFLPQVAPEQGWDIDQTLTHLSVKAGLAPDAWKKGTSFSVFEAIVFGEEA